MSHFKTISTRRGGTRPGAFDGLSIAIIIACASCTKDHRVPDSAQNVHGHMIAFLGCSVTGIQAGPNTFIVNNGDDSLFSGLKRGPGDSGKVIFSYTGRRFGIQGICMTEGNFITVTAIRNE